ncbi:unnamed protein product, partial [Phaeothamnion confervicola]
LAESLLPPETDYEVILVDSLGGNDDIYVGPTVQKTVWIDAGAGDDRVRIMSGTAILVDKAESGNRNDLPEYAYEVGETAGLAQSTTLKGLTLDNPNDSDWFRFTLGSIAPAGAQILVDSASSLDGINMQLFAVAADGSTSDAGALAALISKD